MLIFSKSNLKLQVFGLFLRFVRTLINEVSSSEEPANTMSIHTVRMMLHLAYSFFSLQKLLEKYVDSLVENRGRAIKTSE